MKKLTNLFGKKNTQTFIKNANQKQNFNLFSDNNRPNDKQIPLFGNLNNIRNFQDNLKVQGENKNINININNNIKKELNPKTFVKKPRNFLIIIKFKIISTKIKSKMILVKTIILLILIILKMTIMMILSKKTLKII